MQFINELGQALSQIRETKPLILCLTNFVTMDFMANCLLALGAAPLMSQSPDELEELVALSQSIYINLGTLDQNFSARAIQAAKLANQMNKPIVLDPVGSGASYLRTETAKTLIPHVHIIRGNASEILALTEDSHRSKGVETLHTVGQARFAAKNFARSTEKTVIVSGPIDLVTDGLEEINLPFGSFLMPLVIGMGCTLGAVIAAFAALNLNSYKASILATAYFGLCGQQASEKDQEPGTYKGHFINALYEPNFSLFSKWYEEKFQVAI